MNKEIINQAQKEINEKVKTALFPESIALLEKQQIKLDELKNDLFNKEQIKNNNLGVIK